MQTEPNVTPSPEDICRVWRADLRLSSGAALVYMQRIKLFRAYCVEHGLVEREELTLERVNRFIAWYAQRRNPDPRSLHLFRSALQSLNRVYHRLGLVPPPWRSPRPAKPPATPLLSKYADYLLRHRGNPQATVDKKLLHIGRVQDYPTQAGEDWHSIRLADIDAFLVSYAQRYSRSHLSDIACSIRCRVRRCSPALPFPSAARSLQLCARAQLGAGEGVDFLSLCLQPGRGSPDSRRRIGV